MRQLISRRKFLAVTAAALGGMAATGALPPGTGDTWAYETVNLEIPCPSLPEQFDSYRIGFISDIHFGLWMPESMVLDAVGTLLASAPDLVLLGGDFILAENTAPAFLIPSQRNLRPRNLKVSQMPEYAISALVPLLSRLSARDGVFAVPGNHDLWYLDRTSLRALEKSGLRFLINESVSFSRGKDTLRLSGTDDFWTGIPEFSLPHRKEADEFRILLSHNPDFISWTVRTSAFEFDLGLCGHTHGGQIVLPWLGAPYCNIEDRRLASGLFSLGKTQVYTTRGLGTVELPFRLNCPPEVSILTLKRAVQGA